jgi:hypothetical protein
VKQMSNVNAKQECEKLMDNLLPTAQNTLSKYRDGWPALSPGVGEGWGSRLRELRSGITQDRVPSACLHD